MIIKRELMGYPIQAEVVKLDDGINVLLIGGCRSHIGCVSVAEPDGELRSMPFPGHKEQIVSDMWAKKIAAYFQCRTSVTCGIHYDNLSKEGLKKVQEALEYMLEEVIN